MDYDFNNVRQMLDKGKSIDDICQAFADKVNEANAEYQHEQKRKNTYFESLTRVADGWNDCIDRYADTHNIDSRLVPADFYITQETVDNIITLVYKIMEWKGSLIPLAKTWANVMSNVSSEEKIVTKKSGPTQVSEFSHVIADFLNDID